MFGLITQCTATLCIWCVRFCPLNRPVELEWSHSFTTVVRQTWKYLGDCGCCDVVVYLSKSYRVKNTYIKRAVNLFSTSCQSVSDIDTCLACEAPRTRKALKARGTTQVEQFGGRAKPCKVWAFSHLDIFPFPPFSTSRLGILAFSLFACSLAMGILFFKAIFFINEQRKACRTFLNVGTQ